LLIEEHHKNLFDQYVHMFDELHVYNLVHQVQIEYMLDRE
jgi:hypothetical protein